MGGGRYLRTGEERRSDPAKRSNVTSHGPGRRAAVCHWLAGEVTVSTSTTDALQQFSSEDRVGHHKREALEAADEGRIRQAAVPGSENESREASR